MRSLNPAFSEPYGFLADILFPKSGAVLAERVALSRSALESDIVTARAQLTAALTQHGGGNVDELIARASQAPHLGHLHVGEWLELPLLRLLQMIERKAHLECLARNLEPAELYRLRFSDLVKLGF